MLRETKNTLTKKDYKMGPSDLLYYDEMPLVELKERLTKEENEGTKRIILWVIEKKELAIDNALH